VGCTSGSRKKTVTRNDNDDDKKDQHMSNVQRIKQLQRDTNH